MNFNQYRHVQSIAKKVLTRLGEFILSESTEFSIVEKAKELLSKVGVTETWYHNVPALVLLGNSSCVSISGKDYIPSNEMVGETNLVTIDLSPQIGNIWGDCARSYIVEKGAVTDSPESPEFFEGLYVEKQLHQKMMGFVRKETKFSELFEYGNSLIKEYDYENLDFLLNLGHSIETKPSKRKFIDANCHSSLGSIPFFTFEPHIRKKGSKWGFKHENIYYFDDNHHLMEL